MSDNENEGNLAIDQMLKDWQNYEVVHDTVSVEQRMGVLQRMVTAVKDKSEYLQVFLLAAFDDKREALTCADAISEMQRYGVDIQPIVNRVVSQCAVKADRVARILDAMTKYTLNTNYPGKAPDWKRRQDQKAI
jgi:hypothetical protein